MKAWPVGAMVLAIAAYGVLVQTPLERRLSLLTRERGDLDDRVAALEALAARLPELTKEAAARDGEVRALDVILPATRHVETAKAALYRSAEEGRLQMSSVHAGSSDSLPDYCMTSLAVEVHGGLVGLAGFFDGLSRVQPMMQVRSVVIAKATRGYSARASMDVFCYRSMPPGSSTP